MTDESQLRAYLRLHLSDGLGPVLFRRLIDRFGSPQGVLSADREQWRAVEGVGPKLAEAIAGVTAEQVDAELTAAGERGARIVCECDEDYPPGLKEIFERPPVLYVRGRLAKTDAIALGIVGARRCTHYGLEQSERFAELLARAGVTVVSGGARGIDAAAHRGALNGGGRTIAVMGCGLGMCYPQENEKLFERIVSEDGGALVSELPMATGVQGCNFPRRNRMISGLSLGVLVIEAARRSGALITAREAAEQGREVFAVPGRTDSPMSQGTNELIRDGAILASNLEDILEHLGEVGAKLTVDDGAGDAFEAPPGLTEVEQKLVEKLREGSLELDALVRRSGLPSAEVVSAMTMLVLKGVVSQRAGNVFAIRKRKERKATD